MTIIIASNHLIHLHFAKKRKNQNQNVLWSKSHRILVMFGTFKKCNDLNIHFDSIFFSFVHLQWKVFVWKHRNSYFGQISNILINVNFASFCTHKNVVLIGQRGSCKSYKSFDIVHFIRDRVLFKVLFPFWSDNMSIITISCGYGIQIFIFSALGHGLCVSTVAMSPCCAYLYNIISLKLWICRHTACQKDIFSIFSSFFNILNYIFSKT